MENKIKKFFFALTFAATSLTVTEVYATLDQTYPSKECSPGDLRVFEEDDEREVYGNFGFSRGDMKYLYTHKYDPKHEETVKGRVSKLMRIQFPDSDCYLIAVVSSSKGDFLVNLGPVWFIDENNMLIKEGDTIEVKGAKVKTNGRHILIGAELKKDDRTLTLRNQSGNPQWGTPKVQRGTTENELIIKSRPSLQQP